MAITIIPDGGTHYPADTSDDYTFILHCKGGQLTRVRFRCTDLHWPQAHFWIDDDPRGTSPDPSIFALFPNTGLGDIQSSDTICVEPGAVFAPTVDTTVYIQPAYLDSPTTGYFVADILSAQRSIFELGPCRVVAHKAYDDPSLGPVVLIDQTMTFGDTAASSDPDYPFTLQIDAKGSVSVMSSEVPQEVGVLIYPPAGVPLSSCYVKINSIGRIEDEVALLSGIPQEGQSIIDGNNEEINEFEIQPADDSNTVFGVGFWGQQPE